ncbi:hypothetical protein [Ferruginibacter albus]|uniref:hypothetical protein n=1 Tax=Ferruginibacter albus TaxID=2875540 RepID=UPI001CC7C500|nr:hypothetical protein [Ferruginibacter albus]UAY51919.1 hypothetical protein K9M53_15175 [Ferruginibacter albus]
MRYLYFIIFTVIALSAKGQTNVTIAKADTVLAGMNAARENGIKIEGKFIKNIKTKGSNYDLYLQVADSIIIFNSLMPLDKVEIGLLKKQGNNIILTYVEYYNPVKKQKIKHVQFMQPVYESKND